MGELANTWPLIILILALSLWPITFLLLSLGFLKKRDGSVLELANKIVLSYFVFGLFGTMFALFAWIPISFILGLGFNVENLDPPFVAIHVTTQIFAYSKAVRTFA